MATLPNALSKRLPKAGKKEPVLKGLVVFSYQAVHPNTVLCALCFSSYPNTTCRLELKTKVYKLPKRPHLQHSRYLRLHHAFVIACSSVAGDWGTPLWL